MTLHLSVCVCTHSPRPLYFDRVIQSLKSQTLALSQWELLVIDNASSEPIGNEVVRWHPHARVIREDSLGLTHARLRSIKESSCELLIFVDDDNVLAANYLETALSIAETHKNIGAWSGQCHPEFEKQPAPWVNRYLGMLVIREFTSDCWSNLEHLGETMPCGAGLCVRRCVAETYLALHNSGKRPMLLDRQGTSLMSAGDNDLSACACDIGLGLGLFHKLELTHLISENRTTEDYLIRLADGIYYSAIYLKAFRGKELAQKSLAKRVVEVLQGWRMPARDRRIFRACCRGENRALRELAAKGRPRSTV